MVFLSACCPLLEQFERVYSNEVADNKFHGEWRKSIPELPSKQL